MTMAQYYESEEALRKRSALITKRSKYTSALNEYRGKETSASLLLDCGTHKDYFTMDNSDVVRFLESNIKLLDKQIESLTKKFEEI